MWYQYPCNNARDYNSVGIQFGSVEIDHWEDNIIELVIHHIQSGSYIPSFTIVWWAYKQYLVSVETW